MRFPLLKPVPKDARTADKVIGRAVSISMAPHQLGNHFDVDSTFSVRTAEEKENLHHQKNKPGSYSFTASFATDFLIHVQARFALTALFSIFAGLSDWATGARAGREGTPSCSHGGAVPERQTEVPAQMTSIGDTGIRSVEDSSHLDMIHYTSMLDTSSMV